MKLKQSGTVEIKIDGVSGYHCSRTGQNDWCVSRFGSCIGYADTLDEVPKLVDNYVKKVRKRLRRAFRNA